MESFGIYLPTITSTTSFDLATTPARVLAGGAIVATANHFAVGPVISAGIAAAMVGSVGGLLARLRSPRRWLSRLRASPRSCPVWRSIAVSTACSVSRPSTA